MTVHADCRQAVGCQRRPPILPFVRCKPGAKNPPARDGPAQWPNRSPSELLPIPCVLHESPTDEGIPPLPSVADELFRQHPRLPGSTVVQSQNRVQPSRAIRPASEVPSAPRGSRFPARTSTPHQSVASLPPDRFPLHPAW